MSRLLTELRFVRALVMMNLASAMEYRASFISQIVGMFLNNGIYLVFWLIFFDQFGQIRGYGMAEIFLLFSVVTLGYAVSHILAANTGPQLAYLIAQGRLDYYLVLPRGLLPHIIFSRMQVTAFGDLTFSFVTYLFTGRFHPVDILLFILTSMLAGAVMIGFGVIAGSLAFYMGNAQQASTQATNAVLTFALYPNTLFSGATRFMLYTLLPAAFIGAVPVTIIQERSPVLFVALLAAALIVWVVATAAFYRGLRRYESGSAINLNV